MERSGATSPEDAANTAQNKSRTRAPSACVTCRARKVKCDERPDGCFNCERLQLQCIYGETVLESPLREQHAEVLPTGGVKRKRTFRSCLPCRKSKIKCSGERTVCSRCKQRGSRCIYDADHAQPAWLQTIGTKARIANPEAPSSNASPSAHLSAESPDRLPSHMAACPPSITWLYAEKLPSRARLRNLLVAYFDNIHPIRVFAFMHRPSFMRALEEGALNDHADQALLHIMCALGATFVALEYSDSVAPLSRELIQRAGEQWAKIAERMFFAEYSNISVTKLKVLVLLHDHEARTGNYAASFLLTGMIARLAHALQINVETSTDLLCKNESDATNEASRLESRRRLMWACYTIDVWAGSGVDQLTILNEKDIKLQLPCNERQFLLQIPIVTERLQKGQVLDFLPTADIPEKPWDNLGMSAYYVRIVHIWKRVLRYIKHLDEVQPPWVHGGEFARLIDEIEIWKQSRPPWLIFTSDNIYNRRVSSQLGCLFIVNCMYHHVLCDLHRISLPTLFKIREPFVFTPDQYPFMSYMQSICFEHAQRVSIMTTTVLRHGVRYLADCIAPSLVYNSSRIMLYYIARILDQTKSNARTIFDQTIELVQQNNRALREMSQMYPIAEPLYVTAEEWLEKVRESVARGRPTAYIAPQDPSDPTEKARAESSSPTGLRRTASNSLEGDYSASGDRMGRTLDKDSDATPILSHSYLTNGGYPYAEAITTGGTAVSLPASASQLIDSSDLHIGTSEYPGMENLEQPLFDLNDLQNFFEWENGEIAPPSGLEALGPLGWNNLSNVE